MASPKGAKKSPSEPLDEQIRRRAYELYIQRGNETGSELDDWLQAEEEILQAREKAVKSRR